MADLIQAAASWLGFASRPYGVAGVVLIALYVLQSELRFGKAARSSQAGPSDQGSSWIVAVGAMAPIFGFVLAMKLSGTAPHSAVLGWLFGPSLPGLPQTAWIGAAIGLAGILLRLWAVLTLRHRYTRTLLVHSSDHAIERGGPYGLVRHPGYLGSLLCLNAIAATSGSTPVLAMSLLATTLAYRFRIRAEDAMLVAAMGEPYEAYRRDVGALLPFKPVSLKRPT